MKSSSSHTSCNEASIAAMVNIGTVTIYIVNRDVSTDQRLKMIATLGERVSHCLGGAVLT